MVVRYLSEESRLSDADTASPESAASLDGAHRAFERGDFRESRRLANALKRSATDEATRAAADGLLRRTSVDPAIAWLSGACLAFFVLVIVLSVGR